MSNNNNDNNNDNDNKGEKSRFKYGGMEIEEDEYGFTKSFGLPTTKEEEEEIRRFFEEYGFIVMNNVVTEEEMNGVEDEIYNTYIGISKEETVKDPLFWHKIDWKKAYGSTYNEGKGFLGYMPSMTQAALNFRQSEELYRAFTYILRRKKLWYTYDRYGLMRPTKGVASSKKGDGSYQLRDYPEWKTASNFIHWDLNPWKEQRFCRVQGVVALSTHTKTSGGFHCIPGFHKVIGEWAEANQNRQSNSVLVDFKSPHIEHAVRRITMRRGSVCIWDSRLPHGNWPNDDNTCRMVFYITFFPAMEDDQQGLATRYGVAGKYLSDLDMSQLGKCTTGISLFGEDDSVPFLDEDEDYINLDSYYNRHQWGL
jgi:hypothetical protein